MKKKMEDNLALSTAAIMAGVVALAVLLTAFALLLRAAVHPAEAAADYSISLNAATFAVGLGVGAWLFLVNLRENDQSEGE